MRFDLPKIYPITDRDISDLSHLEQVRRLVKGGARMIQLRDKTASGRELLYAAQEVMEYVRDREVRIVINDRVDVALAVKAHGVHLGQDDLSPTDARRILGNDVIVGYSTHTAEQASAALRLPVNYIAIGPVFMTVTKEVPDPIVGLDGLRSVRALAGDFPVVAIGGIDRQNIADVFRAGANSAAIISSLLADPGGITSRMLEFDRI